MATFEFWLEITVLEQGRIEIEADTPEEAIEEMRDMIEVGNYAASWNYAETQSCRILEMQDENGKTTCFDEDGEICDVDAVAGHV